MSMRRLAVSRVPKARILIVLVIIVIEFNPVSHSDPTEVTPVTVTVIVFRAQ